MRRDSTWCGHPELMAAASVLGCNIEVYAAWHNIEPLVITPLHAPAAKATLRLWHRFEDHFESLIPKL